MAEENQNVEVTPEVESTPEVETAQKVEEISHTETLQTPKEKKNTVGTVGMWFSIFWVIALALCIIGLWLIISQTAVTLWVYLAFIGAIVWCGIPLLFIWLILWAIGVFEKPRTKAIIAMLIPILTYIAVSVSISTFISSSLKQPASEFATWIEAEFDQFDEETFDDEKFEYILKKEMNSYMKSQTEESMKQAYQASTGDNFLEKWAYLFFSIFQQNIASSIEKYNNNELPGFIIDDEIDDEEIDDEIEDIDDEEDEDEEIIIVEEPKENTENTKDLKDTKKSGTFSQSEKNDIEQILDILD